MDCEPGLLATANRKVSFVYFFHKVPRRIFRRRIAAVRLGRCYQSVHNGALYCALCLKTTVLSSFPARTTIALFRSAAPATNSPTAVS